MNGQKRYTREANVRNRQPTEPTKPIGTAVITGASSGIGAAYARELARRGLRPVLVARRMGRLEEIATTIRRDTGTSCRIWRADLSHREEIERVAAKLETISDLDVLVNNAGLGLVGRFHHLDAAAHTAMMELHVTAPTLLSHAALPGMLRRGRGAIVLTASVAAFFCLPCSVDYCATKAYGVVLADCLAQEVRGTGVRVQALCPGLVKTEFHEHLGPEWDCVRQLPSPLWLSPQQVVAASLKGLTTDRTLVITGFPYRVAVALRRRPLLQPAIRAIIRIGHRRMYSSTRRP
ncbi:MAG: SDR family NAD(P)-dependent oxidoreductase [Actinobacteria bacterium]|nr:SDR family NAD(P)-dependent oxidoreductase [Actinomycetota bacterium]